MTCVEAQTTKPQSDTQTISLFRLSVLAHHHDMTVSTETVQDMAFALPDTGEILMDSLAPLSFSYF